jgi:hypothetical protein
LPAVGFDDAVGVFQIALDARAQNFRHQRIGDTDAAPSRLVFVGRTDAAQSCPDALVAEPLLARMVERAVIGEYEMRA